MRISGVVSVLILIAVVGTLQAGESWPQWGGPTRDFTLEGRKLSRDWGEDGPPTLWKRPLGGGFASIVGDGKRLYTAFRDGDHEIVIALDPTSGKTIWEHRYDAPVPKSESLSTEYGKGPNGTPLLTDGKLVALGFTGRLTCLDAEKGAVVWSHDLTEQFEVKTPYFGHATSPLAVGNTVVVVAGGLLAFDLDTGKTVWENREFQGSYGSPRLVEAGGEQQIVTPVAANVAGFDAKTGKTLWSEEFKNQWGTILTSPVIDDAGRVFFTAHQVGSMLVDPAAADEASRRLWQDDTTEVAHSNAVLAGKWVFASVGDSASFMSATSIEDGKQAWKQRGFAQANLVRVGDEFLLLDFEGQLALVELSGKGMKVLTQTSVSDRKTWTPPTLIGTSLYMRDEERMVALDLSATKKR